MELNRAKFWYKHWNSKKISSPKHRRLWITRNCDHRLQDLMGVALVRRSLPVYHFVENDGHVLECALCSMEQLADKKIELYQAQMTELAIMCNRCAYACDTKRRSIHINSTRTLHTAAMYVATAAWHVLHSDLIGLIGCVRDAMSLTHRSFFDQPYQKGFVTHEQDILLAMYLPWTEAWDDTWLTRNVIDLANSIYEERNWALCPILADALLDAGCDEDYIQEVLRKHWDKLDRGCWLVDQLIGHQQ